MDLVEERADLADDIIHHIFSFLDMKYAFQTCTLSKKWKHIWTSMPNINLNSFTFPTLPQFCDFVEHALSHRNNGAEVSAVNLTFAGFPRECVVESIVKYAYLHNVKKLNLTFLTYYDCRFPQQFFSSHTLKHLSLQVYHGYNDYCVIQNLAWDFPVLETLIMKDIVLSYVTNKNLNLFSKCVNLKELTLDGCSAYNIFNICAPQLSTLTITGIARFTTVFNVVAPHLHNLTLTINSISRLDFLDMSPEGLNKVNLSLCGYTDEKYQSVLLDLLPKLHGAKYLILDSGIIETLSSCMNQLSHETCPFDNLECLRINTRAMKQIQTMAIPIQIKNYFLENSPNATFIMDLPIR